MIFDHAIDLIFNRRFGAIFFASSFLPNFHNTKVSNCILLAITQVPLPRSVFTTPLRPDLVRYIHTNMAKNTRQAYANKSTKQSSQVNASLCSELSEVGSISSSFDNSCVRLAFGMAVVACEPRVCWFSRVHA